MRRFKEVFCVFLDVFHAFNAKKQEKHCFLFLKSILPLTFFNFYRSLNNNRREYENQD